MRDQRAKIMENRAMGGGMYFLRLACDSAEIEAPGQFVNLRTEEQFLRRPFSLLDYDEDGISILYKVLGEGTRWLSRQMPGKELSLLMPLGHGYDLEAIPEGACLVAGGSGLPPMYCLAKRLLEKRPRLFLGFFSEEEAYYVEECRALGLEVHVQYGGLISDPVPEGSYICACGPAPMIRALDEKAAGGQYSLETRMGCGFGACVGCSIETREGIRQICKDGPVFKKEALLW